MSNGPFIGEAVSFVNVINVVTAKYPLRQYVFPFIIDKYSQDNCICFYGACNNLSQTQYQKTTQIIIYSSVVRSPTRISLDKNQCVDRASFLEVSRENLFPFESSIIQKPPAFPGSSPSPPSSQPARAGQVFLKSHFSYLLSISLFYFQGPYDKTHTIRIIQHNSDTVKSEEQQL